MRLKHSASVLALFMKAPASAFIRARDHGPRLDGCFLFSSAQLRTRKACRHCSGDLKNVRGSAKNTINSRHRHTCGTVVSSQSTHSSMRRHFSVCTEGSVTKLCNWPPPLRSWWKVWAFDAVSPVVKNLFGRLSQAQSVRDALELSGNMYHTITKNFVALAKAMGRTLQGCRDRFRPAVEPARCRRNPMQVSKSWRFVVRVRVVLVCCHLCRKI